MNFHKPLTAVSLFCSSGIGDVALHAAGAKTLVANEIISERAALFKHNFPFAKTLVGDIWKLEKDIVEEVRHQLAGNELDILFATPPCQGMSKNGRGKLLNAIRKGQKPKLDPRNQLVIPTINIAVALQPRMLIMENVPEMENTVIAKKGTEDFVYILDHIRERLGKSYDGSWEKVEFADYGVPQRRQRLITLFSRDPFALKYMSVFKTILPPRTHSQNPKNGFAPWMTVRDVIGSLPPLDAGKKETSANNDIPFHRVPFLDEDKYHWVSSTPPEKGAFDNQCLNPKCLYQENVTHGASHGTDGINRSHHNTPLYCEKCGERLPRPWVRKGNELRLMKGYTSAYKRMAWNLPASTLTRNLSYACSDNKLHPSQNRVLSLYEAMLLHTITDFEYEWKRSDGGRVSDKLIRESVGESIPPRGMKIIFNHILQILNHNPKVYEKHKNIPTQLELFQ